MTLDRVDAFHVGALLALYEHRTAAQGWLFGVYSFDQFGLSSAAPRGRSSAATRRRRRRGRRSRGTGRGGGMADGAPGVGVARGRARCCVFLDGWGGAADAPPKNVVGFGGFIVGLPRAAAEPIPPTLCRRSSFRRPLGAWFNPTHLPQKNKRFMAAYSTIPAAGAPVANPQGKSLKALVAGAGVGSWRDADGRALVWDEFGATRRIERSAQRERSCRWSATLFFRGRTCKKGRPPSGRR